MSEDASDVAPVCAPPEKVHLLVFFKGVQNRVLANNKGITGGGMRGVDVWNAKHGGEDRAGCRFLGDEEVCEEERISCNRVKVGVGFVLLPRAPP